MERYFYSRFDNKVDRKGRVSVPARWRPILSAQDFNGVMAYPSPKVNAIEGCGKAQMDRLAQSIVSGFNPFSDSHDSFAVALLSRSHELPFDGEGRVILPAALLDHAGIGEVATFVGRGVSFQIWQPEAYAVYEREALARAREEAHQLTLVPPGAEGAA